MERIKLSNNAKAVMRYMAANNSGSPLSVERGAYVIALYELERYGLAQVARVEGGDVEAARLTDLGRSYIASNPTLRNPIDWKWIITLTVSGVAAITSVIALCSAAAVIH